MCHFLTAVLSKGADIDACCLIAEKFQRVFEPVSNQYIQKQLEPKMKYYCMTKGNCDCGTIWGKGKGAGDVKKKMNRKLKKLRNKGWSEAKIKRFIESQNQASQGRQASLKKQHIDCETLAHRWISFISEIIDQGLSDYMGILLHWYSGNLEEEKIDIQQIEKISLSELDPTFIWKAKEDVLYVIKKNRNV